MAREGWQTTSFDLPGEDRELLETALAHSHCESMGEFVRAAVLIACHKVLRQAARRGEIDYRHEREPA